MEESTGTQGPRRKDVPMSDSSSAHDGPAASAPADAPTSAPGTDRLVGATYAFMVEWVEQVVAEHRPGLDGREIATLVHTAGLGVLAQTLGGRDVARPVLSALFRLISGGELYPAPDRA